MQDAYRLRFRRVLEHIEANAGGDNSVERLAKVAAFSKFHFHRQFAELLGLGVHEYVQLVRLKRASYQLAFRDGAGARVLDVALASGYESHEAFARAFKQTFGQTPAKFRDEPHWQPWLEIYERLTTLRSAHMKPEHRSEDVKIVEFPETRVGVLEHRGDPKLVMGSVRRFIEWRKSEHLHPSISATFNLLYDDPRTSSPADFRLDLCAAITRPIRENAFGVVERVIPAGRCAVLRHVGSDDTFDETFSYLYSKWLPASGEEPRDFPLFVQRVKFFPDVPENEQIVDVFLPLRQSSSAPTK